MVSVIFPAAGAGRRMKADRNKVLLELSGVPILLRTLRRFSAVPAVAELIVVVAKDEIAFVEGMLEKAQGLKPWRVVQGGAERQYSIANGMAHLAADADIVLVHDAARPLVSLAAIEAVIFAAREKNTIKVVGEDGRVEATPARASLWEVQTPQGFRREILQRAYEKAAQDGFLGTDDASLVEQIGEAVFVVESDYGNLKITTPEDLWMAEALLAHSEKITAEMKVTI